MNFTKAELCNVSLRSFIGYMWLPPHFWPSRFFWGRRTMACISKMCHVCANRVWSCFLQIVLSHVTANALLIACIHLTNHCRLPKLYILRLFLCIAEHHLYAQLHYRYRDYFRCLHMSIVTSTARYTDQMPQCSNRTLIKKYFPSLYAHSRYIYCVLYCKRLKFSFC